MPRLSIQLPDGSEKTIVLPKNGEYFARIGRDEHCEIVLPFQSVSGEHALLQFKEGAYVLEDLGSTNGIKINGLTPMGAASLYDGDEIALGDARLRFAEEPSPGLIPEPTEAGEEEAAPSAAMRNLQQLADEATRTARKNYLWDGPVCRPDVFPGRFCRVDIQALQGDGRIAAPSVARH